MTFSPGDILMVDVMFTDQSQVKQRPALVLRAVDSGGDFVVAPITSQPGHANAVPLTQAELALGSLPKPSWIRADHVYSVATSTIVKRYGAVKPTVLKAVLAILCPALGCKS
jgi:mRNA-degrading endonuclease toxin of MazEF toxin-antitoxin module